MLVTILRHRSFTVPPVHRNCPHRFFTFGSNPFFSRGRKCNKPEKKGLERKAVLQMIQVTANSVGSKRYSDCAIKGDDRP